MTSKDFKNISGSIPHNPGVYRYYDSEQILMYVGKAKDLRKRVASYFTKSGHSRRIELLVRKIDRIEYTIVESEMDALLLENSLIKKQQPRYNIRLKDDKTYPSICIKKEHFPRVFPTRNIVRDGSQYYGPFTSVKRMNDVLELISRIFPIRNCKFDLKPNKIEDGKFESCLEFQIGNCLAPCIGLQGEGEYMENIYLIKGILKGDSGAVIKELRAQMDVASTVMKFEQAARLNKGIEALRNFSSRSTVVNPKLDDFDVFSIAQRDGIAVVNYMRVQKGTVVLSHNLSMKPKMEEDEEYLLKIGIVELRTKFNSEIKSVLSRTPLKIDTETFTLSVPQRGDKKKLTQLSYINAQHTLKELILKREKEETESRSEKILKEMQDSLRLKSLPRHVECIDNSNFQGSFPVAALVVFRNGKPYKKDYRHFNIKTVIGANDFASMAEVVKRRYSRLLEEKKPLPDLLVVDGGKGQLSSAVSALVEIGIEKKLPVIGIAKNLEEIFYPSDPIPLHLDKKSVCLRVIQHMRNEAHRFGITHHRNKRIKSGLRSSLLSIEGVGEKTAKSLLKEFGSVKKVKEVSEDELAKVIGKSKAQLIFKGLQ